MKLSEKIYTCRKKAGLSQEALSEKIGVSRQAISKWELGEAEPDIRRLKLLAEAFGVSVDWLLSEESEDLPQAKADAPQPPHSWVDSVPGLLGRLLRRYGWLFGVHLAITGGGLTLTGALARIISKSMFSAFSDSRGSFGAASPLFGQGWTFYDSGGNPMDIPGFGNGPFASFATENPVYIMGGVLLVLGIVLLIGGIVLAIVLKKRSGKG